MVKRTVSMTNRQRMEALLQRQKPDRVPMWSLALGFNTLYSEGSVADYYNNPEMFVAGNIKTSRDFGWTYAPIYAPACWGAWEWGGEMKWPSSEFDMAPSNTRFPIETPEEAMDLKVPDVRNAGIAPIVTEIWKLSAQVSLDNEPYNVSIPGEGPFTIAANIPGPSKFVKWLLKYPEAAHHLVRLTTDYLIELTRYWKDIFGLDGVLPLICEATTSNQMIGPKHFEEFALPYIKKYNEKVLDMGYKTIFVHLCGEQNANLPFWAQIPMGDPGIISIGHEVELETAAKYFPNDIIFGNLEPAIIQTGTPEEVYDESKKVIEKGKKLPGGFIFAAGCELPPRAPVDNVMAMSKAIHDFGWYC